MIPQIIPPDMWGEQLCEFADRWKLDLELARALSQGASFLPYPIQIISGYRTPAEQDALRQEGKPAAPNDVSTHLACPSQGADVWTPTVTPTDMVKAAVGEAMVRAGLRWGGGSTPDGAGIPSDWNHFDFGPRT